MGRGTSAAETVEQGSVGAGGTDDSPLRAGKPGRRPKPRPRQPSTVDLFWQSVKHYLPDFIAWLREIPDPRRCPGLCTYPVEYLALMALVMLCGQCGSRRQLNRDRQGKEFGANLWKLLDQPFREACCSDTMNGVLEQVAPEEFERLIARIVQCLHRGKVLRNFLCDGKLVVAVDGTQMLVFRQRHCEHCLTRTLADGSTQYFHYVLAAKIVTPIGLVVPFAFEFVENPEGLGEFDKQDCELKASRRLFGKIRDLFPRLSIMLVGDGLYAEETTFQFCEKATWDFLITLKEDKIPTLDKQLPGSPDAWGGRRIVSNLRPDATRLERRVHWKTPLSYRKLTLHVIRLEETDGAGQRLYLNQWITNVKPNPDNALNLAQTGRLRWKIENEGTNTQKNGGYEMEHGYGLGGNAWKNYYLILQIGQLFNDLVRFGDLLQKLAQDKRATFARLYGTIRQFARCLIESLRTTIIGAEPPPWGQGAIQIRLVGTG